MEGEERVLEARREGSIPGGQGHVGRPSFAARAVSPVCHCAKGPTPSSKTLTGTGRRTRRHNISFVLPSFFSSEDMACFAFSPPR